jgi:hypothetical protein
MHDRALAQLICNDDVDKPVNVDDARPRVSRRAPRPRRDDPRMRDVITRTDRAARPGMRRRTQVDARRRSAL